MKTLAITFVAVLFLGITAHAQELHDASQANPGGSQDGAGDIDINCPSGMCGKYAVKNKPPFQTKRNLPETAFRSDGPLVDDEGKK